MLVRALTPHPVEIRAQATIWGDWGDSGDSTRSTVQRVTTPQSALGLLAVYGSVQLITNEIATLPIHDPYPSWFDQPTPDLNRIMWLSQLVPSMLLAGEAFVAVLRSGSAIVALVPLDPAKVQIRIEDGRRVYYVNGARATFEIIHIPALMWPGQERGLSPVEMARLSIGLGLSAQEFGARYFDGDANMPGVIEMEKVAPPKVKSDLARMWKRNRSRQGQGLPGVLDDGAKWKPTGVTNEQSQFLETRNFTAAEIAGQMFLLDPSDLGIGVDGSSLTYSNLAQRNTRRVQVALMPWIRRIEMALSPYVEIKFDVDARLRGDTRESYETLAIALVNGFLTVDEVRAILNLKPLEALPQELAPAADKAPLSLIKGAA